ncbi:MAG: hypothetical protein JNM24_02615 [Bdellovibrionaceae bacterium]|nr:hypothetical protein [Pseudobdellovibrionaceae bacterium]
MSDDFDSLKKLGKSISQKPSDKMIAQWTSTPFKVSNFTIKKTNWWQLAAALVAGILIGKFLLQSGPDFFSMVAKNHIEDETFEYVYTNN